MAKASGKKKGKKSTAGETSAKPKGRRGNHAVFFSPLPPTPTRKAKRKRVIEDEEDEPPLNKKASKKADALGGDVDPDGDAAQPDRRRINRPRSGVQITNPLPLPRPSSPPPTSPPPESHPSSRRDASPRPSSRRDVSPRPTSRRESSPLNSGRNASGQRDRSHRDSPPLNALQHHSAHRNLNNAIPSNPGHLFIDQLKAMKALDTQDDDLDEVQGEPDEDDDDDDDEDEEEDDNDEEEDDDDDNADANDNSKNKESRLHHGRLGNIDEVELSAEAVDQLMNVIHSRKKQKYSLTKKQSNPDHLPGHFKKWGRHANRLLGVYTNAFKTITTGMMVLKARPSTVEEYGEAYKAVPNTSAAAAKFYTKKFIYLCDVVPKLKALCGHLLYRTEDMLVFAKFFKKHAGAGRSSDISTLKRNFAAYLPRVTVSENVVIRALTQVEYANKARNGGYFSVCTARLILPIHERDDFDDDPIQNTRFMANEHKGLARKNQRRKGERTTEDDKSYPGFLYPSHIDYDALAPQRGIFKNTLCESVVRHLFKGPSSVGLSNGAPNLGRTCLADIYEITKLTPDYLAYAATLIRHLLSVDGRWSGDDKRRSGHRLHTSLHRLLTLDYEMWEEDVESGELFDDDEHWLNENVFLYYNRLVFGAEEGDPEEQVAQFSDYENENDDDDGDHHGNVRARALNARKAELEDKRLRRRVKQQRTPPESSPRLLTPSLPSRRPHAQSIDYAEPRADRAPLENPDDADADEQVADDGEADEADAFGDP